MKGPLGLALDSQGSLYVADSGNNRVLKFSNPSANTSGLASGMFGQTNFNAAVTEVGQQASTIPQPSRRWRWQSLGRGHHQQSRRRIYLDRHAGDKWQRERQPRARPGRLRHVHSRHPPPPRSPPPPALRLITLVVSMSEIPGTIVCSCMAQPCQTEHPRRSCSASPISTRELREPFASNTLKTPKGLTYNDEFLWVADTGYNRMLAFAITPGLTRHRFHIWHEVAQQQEAPF